MFKFTEKEAVRWEKVRVKGKWFYIARRTLGISLAIIIGFDVVDIFLREPIEMKPYLFIIYCVLGLFGGVIDWTFTEAKYQTYLLDEKISAGLKIQI